MKECLQLAITIFRVTLSSLYFLFCYINYFVNNYQLEMEKVLVIIIISYIVGLSDGQLRFGFYTESCPDAESIIRGLVGAAIQSNPRLAPVLLRLHFHDCFVQGCDGSILIDNGPNSEKHAFSHQGVGGYELIEKAKAQLETVCPAVVSCADIVAMAARDAVAAAAGPFYEVESGRRDGLVSDKSSADNNMPDVSDSVQKLKSKFSAKGLSDKDLVLLTAAHTIGTTACFFMTQRLYSFTPNGGTDPDINPNFVPELKATCPKNGDVNVRLAIDSGGEETFDNHILQNIRAGNAVLQSDAVLYEDVSTRSVIDSYFDELSPSFGSFEGDFINSMLIMGRIDVKTGSEGIIRRVCNAFN